MKRVFLGPLGFKPQHTALAALLALAACGEPTSVETAGPETANQVFVDFPSGPLNGTTSEVTQRLRVAGFNITALDSDNGLVQARSPDNTLVDCGTLFESRDGIRLSHPGNTPNLRLADSSASSGEIARRLTASTSVGMGITQGVTNTVVVRQVHRVSIRVTDVGTGVVLSDETLEFTDQGFARFEDGTICRSSNAIGSILS
jgi:hypothetical protein